MTNRGGQSLQADGTGRPPKLIDQMRESMRVRHYRARTEETYCQWVRRYILFHQKRVKSDLLVFLAGWSSVISMGFILNQPLAPLTRKPLMQGVRRKNKMKGYV